MNNTDSEVKPKMKDFKFSHLQGNMLLVIGGAVLVLGSGLIGYTVGHRQGLTVSGFDADAEQLVEVIAVQKQRLDTLNKTLNSAIQERDVAISNANDLNIVVAQAKADKQQAEGNALLYGEVLRQRGGLSLTVQNMGVKPLPDNAFEYQIDLAQISPTRRNVTGTVELRLLSDSEELVVPMENNKFNFKNFERLTGRWTMPEGFHPHFIELRLKGATTVIKRYSWTNGKPINTESAFVSDIPQVEANAQ